MSAFVALKSDPLYSPVNTSPVYAAPYERLYTAPVDSQVTSLSTDLVLAQFTSQRESHKEVTKMVVQNNKETAVVEETEVVDSNGNVDNEERVERVSEHSSNNSDEEPEENDLIR